ncbi:RNA exonuclease 4-like [Patiria miniata]|uniref:RNA exonuclease 4 n=1 Tax=Patiria miniata TaxID=46514 RepID=A0A914AUD0_PATMI|nr:RNA exonuclease 4-like [Patiria miniata]XP_038067367.1 RNA exonuclease 4-like [Patiria miniata]
MMGKRALSGSSNVHDGGVKKKLKSDDTKQRFAPKTSSTDGKKVNKNSSKKFSESQDSGSKKTVKNFWWHSKKVKTIKTSEGNAGDKKANASMGTGPAKLDAEGTGGKGVRREDAKISKKKALQLKKKRQKKNRRLRKQLNPGGESVGDLLREPKTWGKSKSPKRAGKKTGVGKMKNKTGEGSEEKSMKTKSEIDHRTSDAAVHSLKLKAAKQGLNSALNPQGSSQLLNLQKTGGQKERKRKKPKKFKKSKSAKETVSVTGGETSKALKAGDSAGLASAGEEGSRHVKKAKNSTPSKESTTDKLDSSNKTDIDKGTMEEVSSNWKALLPIVEKSKESDAKRRRKFGKGKTSEEQKASKPDIWFDDVDPSLIRANENAELDDEVQSETGYNPLIRKDAQDFLTKCLAMDCEMVGTGPKGSQSVLSRVSVVNQFGACVFDKYVKSREPVTDYRTFVSGIRPQDLREKGEDFEKVQKELSDLLKGRIVVGHALHNDFKVLYFNHPRSLIRDTSAYQPFKDLFKSKRPGLKKLTELVLKVKVQKGEHNSVEDAQAAMKLYLLQRRQWEKSLREKTRQPTAKKSVAKKHKKPKTEALV